MKTYQQKGDIAVIASPSGGNASGDFLTQGALRGVAVNTAAVGTDSPIKRDDVHVMPKATGSAWTQGQALYFDAAAKAFTTVAAGNLPFGVAFAAALTGDTTGSVLLEPGMRTIGGQVSTVTASDTIATGFSHVVACGASLDDNPGDDPMLANASIGDQNGAPAAGSILVKTWKNTGGTDPTPLAASTFAKKVNWWAVGY